MKKTTKICSILLAAVLLFGFARMNFAASATNNTDAKFAPTNQIYYDIIDGKVYVCCQPTWVVGDVVVSDTYEGYPVEEFYEPTQAYIFCSGVTSITLPNSINAEKLTGYPFCGCPSAKIIISEDNPNLCLEDNVLYNKDKTKLIRYQDNLSSKSFTIPESVTEVAESAFAYSNLEELIITNKTIKFNGWIESEFGHHDIKDVYYNGTRKEWIENEIDDEYCHYFGDATIHYNDSEDVTVPETTKNNQTTTNPATTVPETTKPFDKPTTKPAVTTPHTTVPATEKTETEENTSVTHSQADDKKPATGDSESSTVTDIFTYLEERIIEAIDSLIWFVKLIESGFEYLSSLL